jgi:hypothetical protein
MPWKLGDYEAEDITNNKQAGSELEIGFLGCLCTCPDHLLGEKKSVYQSVYQSKQTLSHAHADLCCLCRLGK